ncbi:MAG TPA: CDP-alcohol phosphatidyltransferase family protein [Gemmatimonadota bacterium]|nr:CDP-alcohol phosphatidyltransferase family protein [Gemmatimonadota bacterium]
MNEVPSVGSGEPERVVGSLRLFTLPNALSFARMAVLPPVLYLLRRGDPQSDRWALAILLVAGLTDLLDGWLARRRGAVSASGKVVDPLADKILIGGLVIYLALEREFPMWLLVAIVARDVALMVGAWLFFRRDKLVFAADWTGKWTTFFLGLLILVHILELRVAYLPLTVLATAALATTYVSYGSRAWKYRRELVHPTATPGS